MQNITKLETSLEAFTRITKIPVSYFGPDHKLKWEFRGEEKLCRFFDMYREEDSPCNKALFSAMEISASLGEPYTFVCASGLINIALPVFVNKELQGYCLAGPMVMGNLQESLISNIITLSGCKDQLLSQVVLFLRNLQTYTPKEVSYISTLFNSVILSSVTENKDYKAINDVYREQLRIGEDIQRKKKENHSLVDFSHELEDDFYAAVKTGSLDEVLPPFELLFEEIVLMEAGNLPAIKTKLLSIFTILARAHPDTESDSPDGDIYFAAMNNINEANNVGELFSLSTKLLDKLMQSSLPVLYEGSSPLIHSALEYIHKRYGEKIRLIDIAQELHINPSYLSSLFKQEMRITLTDYVSHLRVMKSKVLLISGNLSLADISAIVGFEDQSYYSKTFKRIEGMTPLQFRRASKQ